MIETIAKVTKAWLGVEDHGHLTFLVSLDMGKSGTVTAGAYSLDTYDKANKRRVGTAGGMEMIRRLLLAFGVTSWDRIVGRTVFVLRESDSLHSPVLGFRPLPTETGESLMFQDVVNQFQDH